MRWFTQLIEERTFGLTQPPASASENLTVLELSTNTKSFTEQPLVRYIPQNDPVIRCSPSLILIWYIKVTVNHAG